MPLLCRPSCHSPSFPLSLVRPLAVTSPFSSFSPPFPFSPPFRPPFRPPSSSPSPFAPRLLRPRSLLPSRPLPFCFSLLSSPPSLSSPLHDFSLTRLPHEASHKPPFPSLPVLLFVPVHPPRSRPPSLPFSCPSRPPLPPLSPGLLLSCPTHTQGAPWVLTYQRALRCPRSAHCN